MDVPFQPRGHHGGTAGCGPRAFPLLHGRQTARPRRVERRQDDPARAPGRPRIPLGTLLRTERGPLPREPQHRQKHLRQPCCHRRAQRGTRAVLPRGLEQQPPIRLGASVPAEEHRADAGERGFPRRDPEHHALGHGQRLPAALQHLARRLQTQRTCAGHPARAFPSQRGAGRPARARRGPPPPWPGRSRRARARSDITTGSTTPSAPAGNRAPRPMSAAAAVLTSSADASPSPRARKRPG